MEVGWTSKTRHGTRITAPQPGRQTELPRQTGPILDTTRPSKTSDSWYTTFRSTTMLMATPLHSPELRYRPQTIQQRWPGQIPMRRAAVNLNLACPQKIQNSTRQGRTQLQHRCSKFATKTAPRAIVFQQKTRKESWFARHSILSRSNARLRSSHECVTITKLPLTLSGTCAIPQTAYVLYSSGLRSSSRRRYSDSN